MWVRFEIHDEIGDDGLAQEVEDFALAVVEALAPRLGYPRLGDEITHIYLSPSDLHTERFPPDESFVAELVEDPLPDDPEHRATVVTRIWTAVSIGMATTVAKDSRPIQVTSDGVSIFIDVDGCRDVATRAGASPDAGVLSTLAHELDHAVRRHIGDRQDRRSRTIEADAQHGMFDALDVLANDARWARRSREAQRVALHLMPNQPLPYQVLHGHDFRRYPKQAQPVRRWGVRLNAPDIDSLVTAQLVEIEVDAAWDDVSVGDLVYIRSTWDTLQTAVVGPFEVRSARFTADPTTSFGSPPNTRLYLSPAETFAVAPMLEEPAIAKDGRPVDLSAGEVDAVSAAMTWQPPIDPARLRAHTVAAVTAETERITQEMNRIREMIQRGEDPAR